MQPGSNVTAGSLAEVIMYINILTFPVSVIGWTASKLIQWSAASQKRINEFLQIRITDPAAGGSIDASSLRTH